MAGAKDEDSMKMDLGTFWIMRLCTLGLTIALVLSNNTNAQELKRTGFNITVLAGTSICAPYKEGLCNGTDPNFGTSIGIGYRFFPLFGISADFFYGKYTVPNDAYTAGVVAGPKLFIPIGPIDLFAGLGFGWDTFRLTDGLFSESGRDPDGPLKNATCTAYGFDMALTGGVEYHVAHDLALGVAFRMHFGFGSGTFNTTIPVHVLGNTSYYANALVGGILQSISSPGGSPNEKCLGLLATGSGICQHRPP